MIDQIFDFTVLRILRNLSLVCRLDVGDVALDVLGSCFGEERNGGEKREDTVHGTPSFRTTGLVRPTSAVEHTPVAVFSRRRTATRPGRTRRWPTSACCMPPRPRRKVSPAPPWPRIGVSVRGRRCSPSPT